MSVALVLFRRDLRLADNPALSAACAAPYFRIFNPVTQAKKFDPDGVYLRCWLPELAGAPLALLHEPWKDPSLLTRSGYPAPMVELATSRQEVLAAFQARNRKD